MSKIIIDGITFNNLVDSDGKKRALTSTYSPNEGRAYDLDATIGTGDAFFDRNREAIRSAFRLLHGR